MSTESAKPKIQNSQSIWEQEESQLLQESKQAV